MVCCNMFLMVSLPSGMISPQAGAGSHFSACRSQSWHSERTQELAEPLKWKDKNNEVTPRMLSYFWWASRMEGRRLLWPWWATVVQRARRLRSCKIRTFQNVLLFCPLDIRGFYGTVALQNDIKGSLLLTIEWSSLERQTLRKRKSPYQWIASSEF